MSMRAAAPRASLPHNQPSPSVTSQPARPPRSLPRPSSALDRYLRRRGKRALRHVVKRLQNELLVLGLLSLMLVAFESYLLQICIPCSGSCSWDCPAPAAAAGDNQSGGASGGARRLQLAAAAGTAMLAGGGGFGGSSSSGSSWAGGRTLLAADTALDAYSCYQASETCAPGSEPFWSQLAIIQVGGGPKWRRIPNCLVRSAS